MKIIYSYLNNYYTVIIEFRDAFLCHSVVFIFLHFRCPVTWNSVFGSVKSQLSMLVVWDGFLDIGNVGNGREFGISQKYPFSVIYVILVWRGKIVFLPQ